MKTNNSQKPPKQAAADVGTFCREMGNQLSRQPGTDFLPKDWRDTRQRSVRGTWTNAVPLAVFLAGLYLSFWRPPWFTDICALIMRKFF